MTQYTLNGFLKMAKTHAEAQGAVYNRKELTKKFLAVENKQKRGKWDTISATVARTIVPFGPAKAPVKPVAVKTKRVAKGAAIQQALNDLFEAGLNRLTQLVTEKAKQLDNNFLTQCDRILTATSSDIAEHARKERKQRRYLLILIGLLAVCCAITECQVLSLHKQIKEQTVQKVK